MSTASSGTPGSITPSHTYHAEAHALNGRLERPIEQTIEHQAMLALNDQAGAHLTRVVEKVSVEGLVRFGKAETRVSGSRSLKHNGWVTTSTALLEDLNVFEIITADRLVAQVSTDHAYTNGHIPIVYFLGSQFINLRVSGFLAELKINLGICGGMPKNGKTYVQDTDLLKRAKDQTTRIAKASGLPKELKAQYDERLAHIDELMGAAASGKSVGDPQLICSLVENIGEMPIPGLQIFGHVMVIPEFGIVSLGEVLVSEKVYKGSTRPSPYFNLTSIKMQLGCVGHGGITGPNVTANGAHNP